MNGPHDLGGQMGFGPVAPEKEEPYFHAEWEKRALGITLSCGAFGAWTIDESRHARESLPPATYLSASYYEIWTRALETLLKRHGFVSQAELDALRTRLATAGSADLEYEIELKDVSGVVHASVMRTIYVARKEAYRRKLEADASR